MPSASACRAPPKRRPTGPGWLGCRTLIAMRASEALERLDGPEGIDIPFSDVVMPGGMNGMQLSVQVRRLGPGLRVLPTSG
ncbi:hypothetical protein LNAOJCKE_4956 [Methylorubrum aminovorans]|uniref:Uncharacterized protein n=1 Tax=Methylorubrum aminovorans TaxID=269069 RepID=A0ABQ4UK69_9HYPH|nr:hypothetical protein [Methylorubrum aminovorans]GJE67724.1 hypothetical protein LNAOJCKE_4956 [Methylorubrum aminovorans]GMA77904.1 hypothetical protein GCM10025880_43210 [Methylorubrum aminovorans]